MRVDWTISALGHALLLACGLVSFSARPFEAPPESVPVDVISAKDFSQVMAGNKKAAPAPKPRPLVEKIAEKKPVEDPTPKISPKPEIKEAKAEPPPDVEHAAEEQRLEHHRQRRDPERHHQRRGREQAILAQETPQLARRRDRLLRQRLRQLG